LSSVQDITGKLKGKSTILVPHTDLDSLIAAGLLADYIDSTGGRAYISLNLSYVQFDNEQVVLVGFSEKPPKNNVLCIGKTSGQSLSSSIYRLVKKHLSDPLWAGKLVLVAGEYVGVNDAKKGFMGVEKEVLDELREKKSHDIGEEYGFRLWGWGRRRLIDQMLHTLIPFMPGVSGNIEGIQKIILEMPGVKSVEEATSSTVFSPTQPEKARTFLERLLEVVKLTGESKRHLMLRLVGHVYYIGVFENMIDLPEIMGSLIVFSSLNIKNPLLIPLLVHYKHILPDILLIYNKVIDDVAVEASTAGDKVTGGEKIVARLIKRPELIRDMLSSIGLLVDKPVTISYGGKTYTSASELLRTGSSWNDIIKQCNVYQICEV
jgi:single-stranded-DNA-specific exonuclease